MGASGTEIGAALDRRRIGVVGGGAFRKKRQFRPDLIGRVKALNTLRNDVCDHPGGQFIVGIENIGPVLVLLADDAGADIIAPVIQLPAQLIFEEFPFLLDDQHLLQSLTEMADAVGFQRPGHADFVEAEADIPGHFGSDAKFVEGFHDIGIGLASSNDPQSRSRRVPDHPVDTIGFGKGLGSKSLVALQAGIFLPPDVTGADADPIGGELEVGDDDRPLFEPKVDGCRCLDSISSGLEADPGSRKPRHRNAEQAIFDIFLHRCRIQKRHEGRREIMV